MGGYWGLFDSAGRSKFPLKGPVVEDPQWLRGFAAMGLGALLFVGAGVARRVRGAGAWVLVAAAGIATGGALASQWRYMVASNRDPLEWLATGAYSIAVVGASLLAALTLACWLGGTPVATLGTWSDWREGRRRDDAGLGALRAFFLFGAAVMAVLLAFDPRYRDFPLPLHAVPAAAFALLAIAGGGAATDVEERWLAVWLALSAPFIVAVERFANLHAFAWAAIALAYAVPVLAAWSRGARARISTASTKATAERS